MLEGKNNTFSLPREIRSIFMQNCFIVSALQHGRRVRTLYSNAAFTVLDKWTSIFLCIIGSGSKHIFEDSEYEKLLEC